MRKKLEAAQQRERERLYAEVNDLLAHLLARYNNRDLDLVRKRLDHLRTLLGDAVDIETVLLGGSVAKHTAVDGLSDVDALVVLGRDTIGTAGPGQMLSHFYAELNAKLPRSEVKTISKGQLAVTVEYRDGLEVQLLPAVRSGGTVSIASADGQTWNDTRPRVFTRKLSQVNAKLNGALVPAIKLMKSLNADLPPQKRLSSYHIESLAVDATRSYKGARTTREVLLHILGHASDRVLEPMSDPTGQSARVDGYLGNAASAERRNTAQALAGLKRRLEAATTVQQWRTAFGEEE